MYSKISISYAGYFSDKKQLLLFGRIHAASYISRKNSTLIIGSLTFKPIIKFQLTVNMLQ